MKTAIRILRVSQVTELTGISYSTLNRLEKKGLFPKRRRIGVRAVGWVANEVVLWISELNQQLHGKSKEQANMNGGVIKSETHKMASGGVDE